MRKTKTAKLPKIGPYNFCERCQQPISPIVEENDSGVKTLAMKCPHCGLTKPLDSSKCWNIIG